MLYVNPSVRAILGYAPEQMMELEPLDLIHPDDRERAVQSLAADDQLGPLLIRVQHADGSWRYLEVVVTDQRENPVIRGSVVNARDVTDRVRSEEQLERQAFYDAMTGLPNRLLFNDRLEHALARAHRSGEAHAVLLLDIDRFQVINDSLGHAIGDALLVQVAGRLAACVRDVDTCARLGGDEFVALLEGVEGRAEALEFARRMIAVFRDPFDLSGQEAFVTGSVGVAVATAGLPGAGELLRMADMALHRAKHDGRAGFVVYDPSMNIYSVERVALESDLQHAIARGELQVYYQPEIDLRTGEVCGAEALLRWQHPRRGLIPPAEFIPLAEETGRISAIGRWVIDEACRQAGDWRRAYGARAPKVMSVNLSARQFQRGDLVGDVAAALARSGIDPGTLRLEITESVIVQDVQATTETLRALRRLGVRLAIDDFGIGYSSLSYLMRLAVDSVKIDKSFIGGAGDESGRRVDSIIRAVASLAHTLDMNVTAEGIETEDQARRVREAGCDAGQGHFFARALKPEQFGELLDARPAWYPKPAAGPLWVHRET
jgi:diguanylate cyclase (GGDEF)-like protein/PAS domain S-box-containing protein